MCWEENCPVLLGRNDQGVLKLLFVLGLVKIHPKKKYNSKNSLLLQNHKEYAYLTFLDDLEPCLD